MLLVTRGFSLLWNGNTWNIKQDIEYRAEKTFLHSNGKLA